MKTLTLILFCLTTISLPSLGAEKTADYTRVQKDISVMAQIIKGAFAAEKDCKTCDPRIETSYLVKQGAVFTIRPSTWSKFASNFSGDGKYSFVIPPVEPVEGVRAIQIKEFVGDVLNHASIALDNASSKLDLDPDDIEFEIDNQDITSSPETRNSLRALQRQRRELEYQVRELELESIHASEGETRDLDKKLEEVHGKIDKLESKLAEASKKFEKEHRQRAIELQARQEKARQAAMAELTMRQDIVMKSLCDYGTTLKNLPQNEYVSIIFESSGDEPETIFVLEKQAIENCSDAKQLRSRALTYHS